MVVVEMESMTCLSCGKVSAKWCEECVVERELEAWKTQHNAPLTPGECVRQLCMLDAEELQWVAERVRKTKEKERDEMVAALKRGEHVCGGR